MLLGSSSQKPIRSLFMTIDYSEDIVGVTRNDFTAIVETK